MLIRTLQDTRIQIFETVATEVCDGNIYIERSVRAEAISYLKTDFKTERQVSINLCILTLSQLQNFVHYLKCLNNVVPPYLSAKIKVKLLMFVNV